MIDSTDRADADAREHYEHARLDRAYEMRVEAFKAGVTWAQQRERDRMAGLLALVQEIRASDWLYDHMPSLHARAVAALAEGEGRAP